MKATTMINRSNNYAHREYARAIESAISLAAADLPTYDTPSGMYERRYYAGDIVGEWRTYSSVATAYDRPSTAKLQIEDDIKSAVCAINKHLEAEQLSDIGVGNYRIASRNRFMFTVNLDIMQNDVYVGIIHITKSHWDITFYNHIKDPREAHLYIK